MCGTKNLIFWEMLDMCLKLMIQNCLAVVGVSVIMGDADTCTVDLQDCIRGILDRETDYL